MVNLTVAGMELREAIRWASLFVTRKTWRRRPDKDGRYYRNTIVQGKPFGSYAWMVHCRDAYKLRMFTSWGARYRKNWASRVVRRKT